MVVITPLTGNSSQQNEHSIVPAAPISAPVEVDADAAATLAFLNATDPTDPLGLVPRDLNVPTNKWTVKKTLRIPASTFEGDMDANVKKMTEAWVNSKVHLQRKMDVNNQHWTSWEFSCCHRRKKCPFRAKATRRYVDGIGDTIQIEVKGEHTDHATLELQHGLSETVKAFINARIQMKPMSCHMELVKWYDGAHAGVTLSQVQTYYGNNKKRIAAAMFKNTVAGWREWVKKHPWNPHLADDVAAVAYSKFETGEFHVLLTTNRMLKSIVEQRRYHHAYKQADATWKITWEGHPLLVMGTVDWGQRFIPSAFMLSRSENDNDYASMEEAVYNCLVQMYPAQTPDGELARAIPILCSDGALAIKNGDMAAAMRTGRSDGYTDWDYDKMLTCYFHMMQGVEKNARAAMKGSADEKKSMFADFKGDLKKLHMLPYGFRTAFDVLCDSLGEKWKKREQPALWEWFQVWLGPRKRWSRAHAPVGLPSASNQTERHNRTLKEIMQRLRHGANTFISHLQDHVGYWSKYMMKPNAIPSGPQVNADLWEAVEVSTPTQNPTHAPY
jgi:hypothetical protein